MTRNTALRGTAWLVTVAACLASPVVNVVYGLAVYFVTGYETDIASPSWDQLPELELYLNQHGGADAIKAGCSRCRSGVAMFAHLQDLGRPVGH